jgi:hypothetical protein
MSIEELTQALISYQKEHTMKMVQKGGSLASKQKGLEELDAEKELIISSNEESSSAKMATTCEHGQILMTINNLYLKVSKRENWQLVEMARKGDDDDFVPPLAREHFDADEKNKGEVE